MNKYYEKDLPEGYVSVKTIDAKDTKFALIMNGFAILVCIGIIMITCVILKPRDIWEQMIGSILSGEYWTFLLLMIVYTVLHELLHGIAYKLLTKQKLTFGLTWSVAYCGVPHIYTYRKTSLIALLTPFVVFNIIFIGMFFLLKSDLHTIFWSVLFGLHVGECAGDLYDTYLLLFRYKDATTLLNDNGPRQMIYIKK